MVFPIFLNGVTIVSKDRKKRKHYLDDDAGSRNKKAGKVQSRPVIKETDCDEDDRNWDWRKALEAEEAEEPEDDDLEEKES
jgi:hypothetical protein